MSRTPQSADATASADIPVSLDQCDHVQGPFFHGTKSPLGHLRARGLDVIDD